MAYMGNNMGMPPPVFPGGMGVRGAMSHTAGMAPSMYGGMGQMGQTAGGMYNGEWYGPMGGGHLADTRAAWGWHAGSNAPPLGQARRWVE
eukprot:2450329-Rhodomonas_salina.1